MLTKAGVCVAALVTLPRFEIRKPLGCRQRVLHTVRVRTQRWGQRRWGQLSWSVLLAVALATFATGCGTSDDEGTPSGSASATSSPRPDDQAAPRPSSRESPIRWRQPRSNRSSATASGQAPRIRAATQPFKDAVEYPDGVRLRVTDVRQGRVTDKGPGVVKGPVTSFDLELSNGSDSSLDLTQVVATVVYGSPRRLSSPVYLEEGQDFRGVVKPGGTAKAVYGFAIPEADLGQGHLLVGLRRHPCGGEVCWGRPLGLAPAPMCAGESCRRPSWHRPVGSTNTDTFPAR